MGFRYLNRPFAQPHWRGGVEIECLLLGSVAWIKETRCQRSSPGTLWQEVSLGRCFSNIYRRFSVPTDTTFSKAMDRLEVQFPMCPSRAAKIASLANEDSQRDALFIFLRRSILAKRRGHQRSALKTSLTSRSRRD